MKRTLKFFLAAIRGVFLAIFYTFKFLFSIPRRLKMLLAGGASGGVVAGSLGGYYGSSIGIAGAFGGISGGIPGAVIGAVIGALAAMLIIALWPKREDKKPSPLAIEQENDKGEAA